MFIPNSIIHGDAYEEIKNWPSKSIDLIVTDPPYLISNASKKKGNNKLSASIYNLTSELCEYNVTDGVQNSILDEFMRIMKKPNIYIWCNKKQILQYLNYFVGIHGCSFDVLVWIKTNPIPLYGRNYMNDKEFCLYFRKGISMTTTYDSGKTYWITPTNTKDKKKYNHPTIKPLEIIKTLVENSSKRGDVVADPFIGSGTTAVAAFELGRNCVGIEKDANVYKIACARYQAIKS